MEDKETAELVTTYGRKGIHAQVDHTHIITSRHGAPLMIEQNQGLILAVTDGDDLRYRGHLFYDLAKISAIRLAQAMAKELRETNITALAADPTVRQKANTAVAT